MFLLFWYYNHTATGKTVNTVSLTEGEGGGIGATVPSYLAQLLCVCSSGIITTAPGTTVDTVSLTEGEGGGIGAT